MWHNILQKILIGGLNDREAVALMKPLSKPFTVLEVRFPIPSKADPGDFFSPNMM